MVRIPHVDWLCGTRRHQARRRHHCHILAQYPAPHADGVSSVAQRGHGAFARASADDDASAEVDFARAAKHDAALRPAWRSHVAATAVGLAAWAAEDADPGLPFCHCAWHVLSAVGMGCTEPFVDKMEDKLLAKRARRHH